MEFATRGEWQFFFGSGSFRPTPTQGERSIASSIVLKFWHINFSYRTLPFTADMSAHFLPRLALRQSQLGVQRRAASSTSEAVSGQAAKAKEGVSEVAGKAQQGLSRVTTSAGSAVSSAASTASRTISSIGGRTGSAISFVQSTLTWVSRCEAKLTA